MRTYRLRVAGLGGERGRERVRETLEDLEFVRSVQVERVEGSDEVTVRVGVSDVVNDLRDAVESLGYELRDVEPI